MRARRPERATEKDVRISDQDRQDLGVRRSYENVLLIQRVLAVLEHFNR